MLKVLRLSLGNSKLQLPPQIFDGIFFVALAVCFGSLSCWKTHPRPIFSALTEGRRLSPKISWYMAPFILPSIRWSHPVPLVKKHPQSIRFPPPCFTVGMVFLGLYSAFLFLQIRRVELMPNSSILVSSPSPKPPPDHPGVLWQTSDGPVHVPSSAEEPSACSRILTLHGVVLLVVLFVTVVPTAFRSLTSYPV